MLYPPAAETIEFFPEQLDSRRSVFDYALCLLLLIAALAWLIAYQHFVASHDKPTNKFSLRIQIQPLIADRTPAVVEEKISTMAPPVAPDPIPTKAPEPKSKTNANLNAQEEQTVARPKQTQKELKQLAAEITAAFSSIETQNANAEDSKKNASSGKFPSRPSNPMPHLNKAPQTTSGLPFAADISHEDLHGNLEYRAENGCVFVKKEFSGEQTWWHVRGCEKPDEITLNYRKEGKILPSFNHVGEK